MPLLEGKMRVKCFRLGKEVSVKHGCLNCEYFSHISFMGMTPLIVCKYLPRSEEKPSMPRQAKEANAAERAGLKREGTLEAFLHPR